MEVKSYTKFIHVNEVSTIVYKLNDSDEITLTNFIERFKEFCLALGYSPSLVERIEIKDEE